MGALAREGMTMIFETNEMGIAREAADRFLFTDNGTFQGPTRMAFRPFSFSISSSQSSQHKNG